MRDWGRKCVTGDASAGTLQRLSRDTPETLGDSPETLQRLSRNSQRLSRDSPETLQRLWQTLQRLWETLQRLSKDSGRIFRDSPETLQGLWETLRRLPRDSQRLWGSLLKLSRDSPEILQYIHSFYRISYSPTAVRCRVLVGFKEKIWIRFSTVSLPGERTLDRKSGSSAIFLVTQGVSPSTIPSCETPSTLA